MESRRSLPSLRLLSVFEALVRTGTIQAAAAELNVTQPAVSQSIRQLEEILGAELLDRRRRPAQLTEAGRILEAATTDGLDRIARAVEHIRLLRRPSERTVTVACSVGAATHWLMPHLTRFYEQHPDITVNVVTTPHGAPALSAEVDLAVRFGDGKWRDGTVTKLFDERITPVCSPVLPAGQGGLPDLAEVPLLHVRVAEASWLSWSRYLTWAGLPEPAGPDRTFTNYVQATQAAMAGQGVLLGWESITSGLVTEGHLTPTGHPTMVPSDGYYLISRGEGGRPAAREVVDWLTAAQGRAGGGVTLPIDRSDG